MFNVYNLDHLEMDKVRKCSKRVKFKQYTFA